MQRVLHSEEYKRLAKKENGGSGSESKRASQVRRRQTIDKYWKKVIFSKESQIVLGTKNHVYIW